MNLAWRLPDPVVFGKAPRESPFLFHRDEERRRHIGEVWDDQMAPEVRSFAKEHLAQRKAKSSEGRKSWGLDDTWYLFEYQVQGAVDHMIKCLGD